MRCNSRLSVYLLDIVGLIQTQHTYYTEQKVDIAKHSTFGMNKIVPKLHLIHKNI